ncbi:MarR family transcriptional regulator [Verrucosispora sp. WMMA2044]|uniref:MarR family transcriptional regulator n=1 Tax=Verrucosispora sioxanthis TaxID=2499994 RepID=A0A6M1LDE0_9ACTN|nr:MULTISPECIES: MarR family transcriptional regulator [Micromonospora]NEE67166.1 MarR family transcriptional regulator [Verrucosispora sioxanthis]NGM16276.1 MarR family transcriptional regulator [Verrucosispora sioxanthis]WBB50606.1 MarR family transcriptional regulator [Verrucosispora sp. WMMA2044]
MELTDVLATNKALVKVAKLYRSAQADALSALALHPGQDVLLWILGQEPDGMTISEIAARLGVEQPTVTRSLSRLDQGGWFIREPVPGDRRATRIRLTSKGRAVIPNIEAAWRTLAETATAGMAADQRAALVELLEKVRGNLRTLTAETE